MSIWHIFYLLSHFISFNYKKLKVFLPPWVTVSNFIIRWSLTSAWLKLYINLMILADVSWDENSTRTIFCVAPDTLKTSISIWVQMRPINMAGRLLCIVEQIYIDVCFHDILQGWYRFQRLDLEKNKISLTILLIPVQSNVQYPILTSFIPSQRQWEHSWAHFYLIHTHLVSTLIICLMRQMFNCSIDSIFSGVCSSLEEINGKFRYLCCLIIHVLQRVTQYYNKIQEQT